MKDADQRFHEEWLGFAQPIEGLVFSVPALADAQIAPKVRPGITAELEAHLEDTDKGPALRDVRAFFEQFLGYSRAGMLVGRDELPAELSFYAQEGRQQIRPSFAIARGPFEAPDDDPFASFESAGSSNGTAKPAEASGQSPYIALVWDLSTDAGEAAVDLDLDKNEDATGPWRYTPTGKLERLLRHTGIPIGFISNRRQLRILYAPTGESSAHLTFRFDDLRKPAGRPLVAALELIFHAQRTYGAAPEFTFEGLLKESRLRQADVTKDLAAQVFDALRILVEGFEHAAVRDCVRDSPDWLRAALEEADDHFYRGVLSVVLRLVFTLYAEDQSLVPVQHPTYAEHLSLFGLYERLAGDAGAHPESMHLRFGAYGRLVALFRAVYLGVSHDDLHLPPRRGKLFDPSAFPFLEGGLPGWTAAVKLPEERGAVRLPSIDDHTIYRVLDKLVILKGQRLSYRALDVEQIGSVYEALMGYHVVRTTGPALCMKPDGVWLSTSDVVEKKPAERARFFKVALGLSKAQAEKLVSAVAQADSSEAVTEALGAFAVGGRGRARAGELVLQPGAERRRTSSHYTPRSLSAPIVRRTLAPLLAAMGDAPAAHRILDLKICDPAMGSGAFLVEACRFLADQLVAAWTREGRLADVAREAPNETPELYARRLIAQRCLYGVDKNDAAVELAKLSLWLLTLARDLPFTFLDHALRHGDSLVGLDFDQVRSFHWNPGKQLELSRAVLDEALSEAIEIRQRILELAPDPTPEGQREKERLAADASDALDKARLVADSVVGAFFAETRDQTREKELQRRLALVEGWLGGAEEPGDALRDLQRMLRKKIPVFHWMLEFPEVFHAERPDPLDDARVNRAAYMDGFVGNPPFMASRQVAAENGEPYIDWLVQTNEGAHGNADYVAYFFRRAFVLLGAHGTAGFIATKAITESRTRTSGLGSLVRAGARIYAADSSTEWSGSEASVRFATVHFAKGHRVLSESAAALLDGQTVSCINSRLEGRPERGEPAMLARNHPYSYLGNKLYGQGFILSSAEAMDLLADGENASIVQRYVIGEELNSSPSEIDQRFVINFGNRSLDDAARWPRLLEIVRERVRPERESKGEHPLALHGKKYWWQFGSRVDELYEKLSSLERCLVVARTPKHFCFQFHSTDAVFSESVHVFPLRRASAFAALQSRIHLGWARLHGRTQGVAGTPVYAASRCFETFPFPTGDPPGEQPELDAVGQRVWDARAAYMLGTKRGLTQTYNLLKDPACDEPGIANLRRLHEEMDRAVLDAYGWTDIPVPPFCPRTPEDKAALQSFEDEVIDRLYVLNAERAREEERLGLGKRKGAKKAVTRKPNESAGAQGQLQFGEREPNPGSVGK